MDCDDLRDKLEDLKDIVDNQNLPLNVKDRLDLILNILNNIADKLESL